MAAKSSTSTSLVSVFVCFIARTDYYLASSTDFHRSLKQVDAKNILEAIEVPYENNGGAEGFNESVLRVLCLNQAIEKMQKETSALIAIRDQTLGNLAGSDPVSPKLENFVMQMRSNSEPQHLNDPHPMSEFDHSKFTRHFILFRLHANRPEIEQDDDLYERGIHGTADPKFPAKRQRSSGRREQYDRIALGDEHHDAAVRGLPPPQNAN